MEPFTFNRQTIAFLCVIAAVELVMILMFSLVAAMLGVFAVLLLFFVWVKTGIRSGKWFWWNPVAVPLTQLEGALALSGALLLAVGVVDVGFEWAKFPPNTKEALIGHVPLAISGPSNPSLASSSSHYTDPADQQRFKDALAKAGVPYSVEMKGGEEYIAWTSQYDDAVEKAEREAGIGRIHGNNVSFGDPKQQQDFREWLAKRGIASEIVKSYGKEFVVWKEGSQELAEQFMNERLAPCPRAKAEKAKPC